MSEVYIAGVGMTPLDGRVEAAYCGSVYEGISIGQRVLAQVGMTGLPVHATQSAEAAGAYRINFDLGL
jgi:hypothetical protein